MSPYLAVIPPTSFFSLRNFRDRRFQLILAPEVRKHPERHVFPRGFVIMDNGLWETKTALPMEDLRRIAAMMYPIPRELVLPDSYRDMNRTLQLAAEHSGPNQPYQLAAVVQGDNPGELVECYLRLAELPYISTLHLPKVMETIWKDGGRGGFLRHLADTKRLSEKQHHLLGIWHSPSEITQSLPFVRSVDTALPVHAALNGKHLTDSTKSKRPAGYLDIEVSTLRGETMTLMYENIAALERVCQGGTLNALRRSV